MRKIDKSTILATEYASKVAELDSNNEVHPDYSSRHPYYMDVLVGLLSEWIVYLHGGFDSKGRQISS
jgi:hypothetical protein